MKPKKISISTKLIFSFIFLVGMALLVSGAIFFVSYTHTLYISEFEVLYDIASDISNYILSNRYVPMDSLQFRNFLRETSIYEEVHISIHDSMHNVILHFSPFYEEDFENLAELYEEFEDLEGFDDLEELLEEFEILQEQSELFSRRAANRIAEALRRQDNFLRRPSASPPRREERGQRHRDRPQHGSNNGSWFPRRSVNVNVQGINGRPYILSVYRTEGISDDFLWAAGRGFTISVVFALISAIIAGYVWGKRITKPILKLKDSALAMAEGNYSVRAEVETHDESADLAESFNTLGARLEDRIRELSEERDSLRNFLADASHELRTPLTSMLTSSEILAERLDLSDERLAELYAQNQASILRMKALVEHLLSLSRLQAGIQYMHFSKISVREVVLEARELVQDTGNILFIQEGTDICFEADRISFVQVFRNCFENSLNAAANSIEIRVREDSEHVYISIIDNGRGIVQEDLSQVSKRFFKGRESEGTGLGLAIVEGSVIAHGGRLQIFSPRRGCEVRLSIPKVQN